MPDMVTRPTGVDEEATRQKWYTPKEFQLLMTGMHGTLTGDYPKQKQKDVTSPV